MNKLLSLLSLLFLVFVSCEKPKRDTIEIYLTKERVPNKQGVLFEKLNNKYFKEDIDSLALEELFKIYDRGVSFDTINKNVIFLGDFAFTSSDLEENPIISNEEIQGFDFKNSQILLKDTAIKKLSNLSNFHQFIILVNKEPVLNGYFENHFSSRLIHTYFIVYYREAENIPKLEITENYNPLYLFEGTGENGWEYPNFQTTNPTFYNTFLNRNKENNLFQN